jgi:hypothetical protein
MGYLDVRVAPDDSWVNRYTGIKLPNDAAVKDPDKLRLLSGPCVTVVPAREGGEKECQ